MISKIKYNSYLQSAFLIFLAGILVYSSFVKPEIKQAKAQVCPAGINRADGLCCGSEGEACDNDPEDCGGNCAAENCDRNAVCSSCTGVPLDTCYNGNGTTSGCVWTSTGTGFCNPVPAPDGSGGSCTYDYCSAGNHCDAGVCVPNAGGPGLSCSPGSQSVGVGVNASLSASNGTGSYTWSAPGGTPNSGSGSSFTTNYSTTGTKTVTLSDGSTSTNCSVSVTSAGGGACDISFPADKLHVCYFAGTNPPLTNAATLLQKDDPASITTAKPIDHDWGFGGVDETGRENSVSAVWRGTLNFAPGIHTFHVRSDDGVELQIDGQVKTLSPAGAWGDHAPATYSTEGINISGSHTILIKWYENGGGAVIKFWWDVDTVAITENNGSPLANNAVKTDGTTPYKIVVTDTTPYGAGYVSYSKARINYQGENAGQERGFLTWHRYANTGTGVDVRSCGTDSGGNATYAELQSNQYTTLDSCSFSDSGNTNTVTFVVKFKPAYTTPVIDNDISAYIFDTNNGAVSDWTNFDTNYNLYIAPPTITGIINSECGKLTVNWTDNSTNETGFRIYRAMDAPSGFVIAATKAANSTTHTDTTPPLQTNHTYYYYVVAYVTEGTQTIESSPSATLSALNQACTANLAGTQKEVYQVNGVAYNNNTLIKDNDVITYVITIKNNGPADILVNYICDTPSSQLTMDTTSLKVNKTAAKSEDAAYVSFPTGIISDGPTGNCPNTFRLSGFQGTMSGTSPGTSWFVKISATYHASGNQQDVLTNTGVINYAVAGVTYNKVVRVDTIINLSAGVPNFREIAP